MKPHALKISFYTFPAIFTAVILMAFTGCVKRPGQFDDNVVAQFVDGVITTDQLNTYISKIVPKCHAPAMQCSMASGAGCMSNESCDMHDSQTVHEGSAASEPMGMDCCGGQHGGEHAGCCGGSEKAFKDEPCSKHLNCCTQHYKFKAGDYSKLVRAMVLEQMLQKYIRENKIDQTEETLDYIRYVSEKIYVTDTHLDMEESMKPPESEIRKFYEEHRELFDIKTINEVRDEITEILKQKMHHEYMPEYVESLKRNALIRKNLDLIKPREPSEGELRSYYSEHRNEYVEPLSIKVQPIVTGSRQKAERAQYELRSGESFGAVAAKYSEVPFAPQGGEMSSYIKRGDRGKVFEENVFYLDEGETSTLFEDNGSYFIVQVLEKREGHTKSFWEVADSIREKIIKEKEKSLYEESSQKTLFTVNSRSYTVKEFRRRFDNLPPSSRMLFNDFSGKEKLVDLLIEYELLVDDAHRKMFDLKNRETVQDITNAILEDALYEKEIIRKITSDSVRDEEIMKYYEKNKGTFIKPPMAVVSFIRIPVAVSESQLKKQNIAEMKAARKQADEAYAQVIGGLDFESAARKYSADDWSSQKLPMYEKKDMPLAGSLEEAMHPIHRIVFEMEEGGVSEPFQFQGSFFIFKLWEKSDKEYIPLNEVKETIRTMLVDQKRRDFAANLQKELMEKSQLKLNERALEAMAEKKGGAEPGRRQKKIEPVREPEKGSMHHS